MSRTHFESGQDSPPVEDASTLDHVHVHPVPAGRRRRLFLLLASMSADRALAPFRIRWPLFMFAALVLAIAVLGAALAILNSPLLDISRVEVEGAHVVSAASVKQLAGVKGQHVLLADLEAARQRIRALPMVKEVEISRDWPNGIKVAIVERAPWGRWRANDTVWAIDSEGIVLEGPAPAYDGPIVTQVSALPAIAAGAQVDTTALQMADELHRRGAPLPLPAVLSYEWSLVDGLVVVTEHGRIVFGGADGLDFKYTVWALLEEEAQGRGEPLLFADLRFGLRPSVEIGLNLGRGVLNREPHTAHFADNTESPSREASSAAASTR
ncbi:MAG: FtsQ-type POTRA domain-containing protein [Chloroflexi bacterium]|nr:FtsQ-type POTRA domain-containing protein [Chloroflexota bacterium]